MSVTSTLLVIDPPYYAKGPLLYLNTLDASYHSRLAERLRILEDLPWVLTYDDCPQIRALYSDWAQVRPFSLRYSAAVRRGGAELMIAPRWMQLPASQRSEAIVW